MLSIMDFKIKRVIPRSHSRSHIAKRSTVCNECEPGIFCYLCT